MNEFVWLSEFSKQTKEAYFPDIKTFLFFWFLFIFLLTYDVLFVSGV